MSKEKTTAPAAPTEDAFALTDKQVSAIRERVYTSFGLNYTGNIDEVTRVSARELSESGLIGWINSYKALLKYVSKDYREIFQPKTTGSRSGTRYYVPIENIVTFLVMFEENKL